MSSLLSGSAITVLTGIFSRHFDTFGAFQPIVVNKEPKKTTTTTTDPTMPGYGDESNTTNITYSPVSGVFPAIIVSDRNQRLDRFPETEHVLPNGITKIKILKNARDYIKNGKTESICINDITYNTISDDGFQNYLGLIYYYFTLVFTSFHSCCIPGK